MSTVVGDSIRARLEEIDAEVAAKESVIKEHQDERKSMLEERKILNKSLAQIEHIAGIVRDEETGEVLSTNGDRPRTGRKIEYDELKAAVAGIGRPAKSTEIAEALGTLPNMIARKLKKLVDDGELGGDKLGGFYSLT